MACCPCPTSISGNCCSGFGTLGTGQERATLYLDLSGNATGCLSGTSAQGGAQEVAIPIVYNTVTQRWEDNPPSSNILAPFVFSCSGPNFFPEWNLSWVCPVGGTPNLATPLSGVCNSGTIKFTQYFVGVSGGIGFVETLGPGTCCSGSLRPAASGSIDCVIRQSS